MPALKPNGNAAVLISLNTRFAAIPVSDTALTLLWLVASLFGIFEGAGRYRLESMLFPEYLPKQRWFGGKARRIRGTSIADWMTLPGSDGVLVMVDAQYEAGEPDRYLLPLALAFDKDSDRIRETLPNAVVSSVIFKGTAGLLIDGINDDFAGAALLALIEHSGQAQGRRGFIRGAPGTKFPTLRGSLEAPLPVRRGPAEQSNSSLLYGDRLFLKLFRRLQPGPNPECEIGRYLTEQAHFDGVPPFAGEIEYVPEEGIPATLAVLQGQGANQGDGWTLTLEELGRYYENCATVPFPTDGLIDSAEPEPSQLAREHVGISLEAASRLGRRTAQLHLALASSADDPAFTPVIVSSADLQNLLLGLRKEAIRVLDVLKDNLPGLPDEFVDLAGLVLGRRRQILDNFHLSAAEGTLGQRIRIHGDYHLGQVLQVKTDYVVVDFEGEPARPIAERRAKRSPLKDVAGMLRSLSYAAYQGLIAYTARRPEDWESLEPWARLWERSMGAEFLRAYRTTAEGAPFLPCSEENFRKLLAIYLLDKALYELLYELNNRPAWVRIPLIGILSLPMEAGGRAWNWMPLRNRN